MALNKKLAIFDLDGTLYDTKNVNYKSYQKALEEYGINLNYEHFCNFCNGRKYSDFLPRICGFNDERIIKIHNLKKKYYSEFLCEAVENSHLFSIAAALRKNYFLVIVTTASRKNVDEILTKFERNDFFDKIYTQEDIAHPKPDPEGFVTAMNNFNCGAANTVIFEDSQGGVEAALKVTPNVYVFKGFQLND